jgi:energy-coupling factor transport system ATP-binding protein
MELLEFKNVSFQYAGSEKKVLKEVSFSVRESELALIIGSSGCGKTTILKHMKKNMIPCGKHSGGVYYNGREISTLDDRSSAAEMGFVQQNPDNQIVTDKVWHELAFGLENLGLAAGEIRKRTAEMAEYFGISGWFRKDVSELSGGQKQLLNLAAIMVMQPQLLILDEPTAQLDPIAAERFLDTVIKLNKELGTTIVITEHRLEKIYAEADRIIALEDGTVICNDTAEAAVETITRKYAYLGVGLPVAMRIYAGLQEFAQDVITTKCPMTMRDARLWLKAEKKNLSKKQTATLKSNVTDCVAAPGTEKPIIKVKDLYFRYTKNGAGILDNLSFTVTGNRVTAILGGNGAGKSTLLKLIAGVKRPVAGRISCNGRVVLMPQNPLALFTEISVEEELAEACLDKGNQYASRLSQGEKIEEVERMLAFMGLMELRKNNPYDLSGGQQQKLALAKVLLYKPDILLLDEPTKGLDPYFKQSIGQYLRGLSQAGMTVVMATHDVEFCAEYADECALVFNGGIADQEKTKEFFAGNRFYTTQANRIAGELFENCVTCEDVVEAVRSSR